MMTPFGSNGSGHTTQWMIITISIKQSQHRKQRARKKQSKWRTDHSKQPWLSNTVFFVHNTNPWKAKQTNTSLPMSSPKQSGNKRTKEPKVSPSNKKSNTGKMDLMEVDDDEKTGPGILSTKTINTTVNAKYHDVLPTILDFGGTDNHTAKSCMPFVSATGQGSVASEKEWMLLASNLASKDRCEESDIKGPLTNEEVVELRVFLNWMAYTPPTVTCTKVKNSQCSATSSSSCWYGAKIKKQKKLNIAKSLRNAEEGKQRWKRISEEKQSDLPKRSSTPTCI